MVASVELCMCAKAHSEILILESFAGGIKKQDFDSSGGSDGGSSSKDSNNDNESSDNMKLNKNEIKTLRVMFVLLAVKMISSGSGQFLAAGGVRVEDFSLIGWYLCFYFFHDFIVIIIHF